MPDDDILGERSSATGIDADNLLREHIGWMLTLAESMLRDRGLAEDTVQNAFLAAFRARDRFDNRSSPKTWLHRITVNAALDRLRQTNRLAEQPIDHLLPEFDRYDCRIEAPWDGMLSPQEVAESADLQRIVRQKIDALPDAYRIVLQLRDFGEFDTQEVAEMLDISPANVKVRLHRARAALKKLLEPLMRGEVTHEP
jgi:RNA polymerase sigma-70 factor (ECF subfamily)